MCFSAMFKQQGYEVKELPDDEDEVHVFVDLSGATKVSLLKRNFGLS